MVVAMAMLMVVFAGLYRALKTANMSATSLSEMSQQEADSRRAVDVLVTDLRMAWSGDATKSRVEAFDTCSLTFYAPSRDATPKLRRIQYTVSGTDLMRSETFSTNTAAPYTWPGPPATPTWSPAVKVLGGLHDVPPPSTLGCSCAYPVFASWNKIDPTGALPAQPSLPGTSTAGIYIARVSLTLTIDRIVGKFPDPDVFQTSVELRSQ
jgi:hypothetical protein